MTDTSTTTENPIAKSILNVTLVIVETFITLVLRFDENLRKIVYPLAKDNVVVCVRSYVPHITLYATFSYHGVLLDSELRQEQQVDVTINAFTLQLFQAIFTHDVRSIDKLQMRGEALRVEQVKRFLLSIGVGQAIQNLAQTVKGKTQKNKNEDNDEKDKLAKILAYKNRIDEQQTQINTLTVEKTQLTVINDELKSKNKILMMSLGVSVLITIFCIIGIILKS